MVSALCVKEAEHARHVHDYLAMTIDNAIHDAVTAAKVQWRRDTQAELDRQKAGLEDQALEAMRRHQARVVMFRMLRWRRVGGLVPAWAQWRAVAEWESQRCRAVRLICARWRRSRLTLGLQQWLHGCLMRRRTGYHKAGAGTTQQRQLMGLQSAVGVAKRWRHSAMARAVQQWVAHTAQRRGVAQLDAERVAMERERVLAWEKREQEFNTQMKDQFKRSEAECQVKVKMKARCGLGMVAVCGGMAAV